MRTIQRYIDASLEDYDVQKERKINSCFSLAYKPGYIYIIQCLNMFKIGRTEKPKNRILTYKTENPFPIKLIGIYRSSNYIDDEQILHKCYKNQRIRGEWFRLKKKDINQIINYFYPPIWHHPKKKMDIPQSQIQ